MSKQVTYQIDHISLLQDSTISSALNFCSLCILLQSNVYIENQYYYYFGLPKIRVGWACATKN